MRDAYTYMQSARTRRVQAGFALVDSSDRIEAGERAPGARLVGVAFDDLPTAWAAVKRGRRDRRQLARVRRERRAHLKRALAAMHKLPAREPKGQHNSHYRHVPPFRDLRPKPVPVRFAMDPAVVRAVHASLHPPKQGGRP